MLLALGVLEEVHYGWFCDAIKYAAATGVVWWIRQVTTHTYTVAETRFLDAWWAQCCACFPTLPAGFEAVEQGRWGSFQEALGVPPVLG